MRRVFVILDVNQDGIISQVPYFPPFLVCSSSWQLLGHVQSKMSDSILGACVSGGRSHTSGIFRLQTEQISRGQNAQRGALHRSICFSSGRSIVTENGGSGCFSWRRCSGRKRRDLTSKSSTGSGRPSCISPLQVAYPLPSCAFAHRWQVLTVVVPLPGEFIPVDEISYSRLPDIGMHGPSNSRAIPVFGAQPQCA